jgi:septum formation protein
MKRIILASASPRRRELLSQVGVTFEVIPSTVEEICNETNPSKMVEKLSEQKAESVAKTQSGDFIVIGADTIVAKDGVVLGKPSDEENAFVMLQSLQGTVHQVYSGVTLVSRYSGEKTVRSFHVMTTVELFPMTEGQMLDYIATGDCMDKAGAYGIQGCFAEYVKGITGDYYNVVGLPISRLMRELRPLLEKVR